MDHVIAGPRLRLTYASDRQVIRDLVADVLAHAPCDRPSGAFRVSPEPSRLADFDHLVLATDRLTGRYLGLLSARERATRWEPFLLVDAEPPAAGFDPLVLRRMVALLLLLRIAALTDMPAAIAARTRQLVLCQALRALARTIPAARFHPRPDGNVIALDTAALAHRIARQVGQPRWFAATAAALRASRTPDPAIPLLAVLDLGEGEETAVIDAARRLYRSRPAAHGHAEPSATAPPSHATLLAFPRGATQSRPPG